MNQYGIEVVPGLDHKQASSIDIRKVVDDPEWQELRKSFVGTWKSQMDSNIDRLIQYLRMAPDDVLRWRRVHNYLTGSAFRIGVISHSRISELLNFVRVVRFSN